MDCCIAIKIDVTRWVGNIERIKWMGMVNILMISMDEYEGG